MAIRVRNIGVNGVRKEDKELLESIGVSLLPEYIKMHARHDFRTFEHLIRRTKPFFSNIKSINVLDVGCGIRAPFTLLFNSLGARAIGIDMDVLTRGAGLTKYHRVLANQGLRRFLERLVADCYYDTVYYKELEATAGFPLLFEDIELMEIDARHTPFEEEFDLVVSNAVFEHIKDIDAVLREMSRIMKQNAIMHVEIHLFPSLTGGHNVPWSNPDTGQVVLGRVPPWDHLRNKTFPINPTLNKLREKDYFKIFSKNFEILDWITEYEEPEKYLTPELSKELNEYSREELLKRSIVIVARKAC